MKKISQALITAALCMLIVCLNSCKKEDSFPVFPAPHWTVDANPDYSVSMTAIVVLPPNLNAYSQTEDQMAAFIGEECRGVAQFINGAYYLLIKGSAEEQAQVSIRYYSARNQYMYTTGAFVTFEADAVHGTADKPVTLPLTIINE